MTTSRATDKPSLKFQSERVHWLGLAASHLLEHGYQRQSFRSIAEAIGTSHRMLTHYFGSAEQFWEALVRHLRSLVQAEMLASQTQRLTRIEDVWLRVTQREYLSIFRLTLHLYEQALHDPGRHAGFLRDVIDDWVQPVSDELRQAGLPPAEAKEEARLRLAVFRGLMLDLLTTGDLAGTTQALKRYASYSDDAAARKQGR